MGTLPDGVSKDGAADASYTQHPTTVSVGPYSLINRVLGACDRQ